MIESMTGARFVHDTLEELGWEVLIADAAKVKGLRRWRARPTGSTRACWRCSPSATWCRRASEHPQDIARTTHTLAHRRLDLCDHRVSAVSDRCAPERALTFARGPGGVVLASPAPKELQLDAAWPGFDLALKRLG